MQGVTLLTVISTLLPTASAIARPQYVTSAPIAYMVDMASGAVLIEKQSRKKIPPASMAKMMTAYVVFELIESGRLDPETKFTVRPDTWKAWNNRGSTMFLKPREQVRVADLMHGMVTLSGNDAAMVLAEGIAGSEPAFVVEMNAAAKRLGMKDSRFGTATGWPDNERTLTTAHDLALLGMQTIRDFPELYRQYYGQTEFLWNTVTQTNRNPILGKIAGADGLKTGHTEQAGYCFTGTAEHKGRRVMMVIAGFPSTNARADESIKMMRWGFEAWRAQPLFRAGRIVAHVPVQRGVDIRVTAVAPHNLALALPVGQPSRYKLVVRYRGPVKAPFERGTEVAQLVAKFSDGSEQIMPLVASRSVAETDFFGRARNGFKYLVGA